VSHSPGGLVFGLVAATLLTLGSVEGFRRLAVSVGILARPNPLVKSHRVPVPYLGGTAVFLALFGLWWILSSDPRDPTRESPSLLLFGMIFVAIGTWDDIRPLSATKKILLEVLVCTSYVLLAGESSPIELVGRILILLTLVNAFNLIDVMDGLLCLLASISVVALLLMPAAIPAISQYRMLLLLVALGVLFAFNRPPAAIYAGDAGSLTLGFLIGVWILEAAANQELVVKASLLGPVMIPVLEVVLVVAARLRSHRSPFRGSADHFALRLQDRWNWGKGRILIVTGGVGTFFAMAPVAATRFSPVALNTYGLISLCLAVTLWIACWQLTPSASERWPRGRT
jgi:UDP-GlcNAc:undecaprenyl-phosphate GlcNAc-1-phosphate transferase